MRERSASPVACGRGVVWRASRWKRQSCTSLAASAMNSDGLEDRRERKFHCIRGAGAGESDRWRGVRASIRGQEKGGPREGHGTIKGSSLYEHGIEAYLLFRTPAAVQQNRRELLQLVQVLLRGVEGEQLVHQGLDHGHRGGQGLLRHLQDLPQAVQVPHALVELRSQFIL
jgi:hypothetical protein